MDTDPLFAGETPSLVLGASGRIGRGLQRLAQAGQWPGPVPLWQARPGVGVVCGERIDWDILATAPPDLGRFRGIIGLAGAVNGDMAVNTALALAAIDLAGTTGCGPVLLTSSAAVYGPSDCAVTEHADCRPTTDYGRAKLAMEQAVAARLRELGKAAPVVCILRIGNVAGADALLLAAGRGPVTLDRFADGNGPERSYVGMLSLARIMAQLIALSHDGTALPPILNIAAPRPVQMAALLRAAQLHWVWTPAPPDALPRMVLLTDLLNSLLAPDPTAAEPAEIIRQSRLAGWAPA